MKNFIVNSWYWIVIIIALVVFGFIKSCESSSSIDEASVELSQHEKDSINGVIIGLRNQLESTEDNLATYKAKLDTCEQGLKRPLTVEQRLAAAEEELNRLKSQPAASRAPRYVAPRAASRKADVAETHFESSFTAPTASSSSRVSVSTNNTIPNSQVEGQMNGEVGMTVNPQKNPIYFIKDKGLVGKDFWVNGDVNKKMIFDAETGYWFYINSNRIMSDEDMNSFETWNIKGGVVNWGGGTYDMWYPHESLKPLISSVRGFEYGLITPEDLVQMSKRDGRVWSSSNPNGVFQPLQGINKDKNDQNFYHGWNFRARINYKKITN